MLLVKEKYNLISTILNGYVNLTISDFSDNSGRKICPDSEYIVSISEIFSAL